jgi:hypothetical protein
MTKVIMTNDLLAYRQEMKKTLLKVLGQTAIGSNHQSGWAEPALAQKDLLPPPCIMALSLEGYKGQGDDLIGIWVDHDFGMASVHVTVRDLRGNLIERGDACPFSEHAELWWYYPSVFIPKGTPVVVEVTATDSMGGLARWGKSKTLGEPKG